MAEILTPDLCIIGAGSGGLPVAEGARAYGASVVLVERKSMGGDDLNSGGIPSKALIGSARHAHAMRTAAPFGIANDEPKINFRRVHDHIHETIDAIAPRNAIARYEALGVQVINAEARFLDKRTVQAGETLIRARRFIIATGSSPVVPDVPGLSGVPFFTTDTLFENTRKLSHLVIIGGGATGVELAQAYRRLGASVSIIEAGTVLAGSDPELVAIALRRMREEGVAIHERTTITAIQQRPLGIGVVISSDGKEQTLDASHILVAAGRKPNLDDLDLAKANVGFDKANPLLPRLGANLKTSNGRVYIVGDATGGQQFTHAAAYQADLVLRNALFGFRTKFDASLVPNATYTDPEIAEVGLTEPQARARLGSRYKIIRASFADNDRARTNRDTEGLVKMVTDSSGRILGAGIVGAQAGEMIALFSFAVANKLNARHLAAFVAPYPTLSEIAQRLGTQFSRERGTSPWLQRLLAFSRLF
jgi:pyruvate/2-oxoglutarate dehydrogenase complex dihydrolipoamide dehydrogenase (E3) component